MLLRGYQPGDLDALYALDVICFQPPFRFSRGAMRRFAAAKRARVIVADDRGNVAGFVIVHLEESGSGRVGYIVTLDVSPVFRRQGIARTLMEEAEWRAREEGCAALVLHVYTANQPAIQFYAAIGFARSHREEDFYKTGHDAWVFHKMLPPSVD